MCVRVPFDTHADADRIQIETYRRTGGAARTAVMFRLNELARSAAIAGIRSGHPQHADDEVHRALARLVLGDDWVRRIWPNRELVAP